MYFWGGSYYKVETEISSFFLHVKLTILWVFLFYHFFFAKQNDHKSCIISKKVTQIMCGGMELLREIMVFFLSSMCRIDHIFFCCILYTYLVLDFFVNFFCRFVILYIAFWNRLVIFFVHITRNNILLNIYTYNNKFFCCFFRSTLYWGTNIFFIFL